MNCAESILFAIEDAMHRRENRFLRLRSAEMLEQPEVYFSFHFLSSAVQVSAQRGPDEGATYSSMSMLNLTRMAWAKLAQHPARGILEIHSCHKAT